VLRRVDLDRLQFHGEESEEQVESVDLPVIKAIRGADKEAAEQYPGTMLCSTTRPRAAGAASRGSGRTPRR
jgi:phosphoribosylanthranilate isomerase